MLTPFLLLPNLSQKISKEKHFVVIICTYNNREWAEKNLASVVDQEYNNFHVIIIDDASTDGTNTIIENYIKKNNLTSRVTFIRNTVRTRKLANLYRAIHSCNDYDIIVLVDGDDWLIDSSVLSYINDIYQNRNIWFTYGQYHNIPANEALRWGFRPQGYCRAVPERIRHAHAYRSYAFIYMHLRTFYAWLFKNIKLEDLLCSTVKNYEGNFYPASNDNAIFYPIIEMASDHVKFVSKILYTRNLYSDIVGFKVDKRLQIKSSQEIRRKKAYPSLNEPVCTDQKNCQNTVDCILFFPEQGTISSLNTFIATVEKQVFPLTSITIFAEQSKKIILPQTTHVPITIITYDKTKPCALSHVLENHVQNSTTGYSIFTHPLILIHTSIDLITPIQWLEKTKAHAFYFTHELHSYMHIMPWLVSLYDGVGAWKFKHGCGSWHIIYATDFVLYRTTDIRSPVTTTKSKTYNELKRQLNSITYPEHKVGLFFETAKAAVKVPH